MANKPLCLCHDRDTRVRDEIWQCKTCGVDFICKPCIECCHKGHDVCISPRSGNQNFICECQLSYGKNKCKCCDNFDVCTNISLQHRRQSGLGISKMPNSHRQRAWHCETCGIVGNNYICTACKDRCHVGHKTSEAGILNFMCCCGSGSRVCKATSPMTEKERKAEEKRLKKEEKEKKKLEEKRQKKCKKEKSSKHSKKHHKHSEKQPTIVIMPIFYPVNQLIPDQCMFPPQPMSFKSMLPYSSKRRHQKHKKYVSSDYSYSEYSYSSSSTTTTTSSSSSYSSSSSSESDLEYVKIGKDEGPLNGIIMREYKKGNALLEPSSVTRPNEGVEKLFDTAPRAHFATKSIENSYLKVSLKDGKTFVIDSYAIKGHAGSDTCQIENWKVEGERVSDGEWILLDQHNGERLGKSQIRTFDISCKDRMKSVKITHIGKRPTGDYHFCISGFDIFGNLYQ